MRATGGSAALPIWLQFLQAAHPDSPPRDFPVPDDVTLVRADDRTGNPAPPGASGARWIPFLRGTVPTRFAGEVRSTQFRAQHEFAPETPEEKDRQRKRPLPREEEVSLPR
jgi:penicillin-binding protein 1A